MGRGGRERFKKREETRERVSSVSYLSCVAIISG